MLGSVVPVIVNMPELMLSVPAKRASATVWSADTTMLLVESAHTTSVEVGTRASGPGVGASRFRYAARQRLCR